MAVTYTVRNATVTNSAGHSYGVTHSVARFYTSFDLSGWDEASSANFNGPTADGTILLGFSDGDPIPDIMS
jgi:hypothetical protein